MLHAKREFMLSVRRNTKRFAGLVACGISLAAIILPSHGQQDGDRLFSETRRDFLAKRYLCEDQEQRLMRQLDQFSRCSELAILGGEVSPFCRNFIEEDTAYQEYMSCAVNHDVSASERNRVQNLYQDQTALFRAYLEEKVQQQSMTDP